MRRLSEEAAAWTTVSGMETGREERAIAERGSRVIAAAGLPVAAEGRRA